MTKSTHNGEAHRIGHLWGIPWEVGCCQKSIAKNAEKLPIVEGDKRRKVIPPGIGDLLDPVSLAVWYMDDGGKAQNTPKGAYINVSNFSEPERELLRDSVNMVFELKMRLHKAEETTNGTLMYLRSLMTNS